MIPSRDLLPPSIVRERGPAREPAHPFTRLASPSSLVPSVLSRAKSRQVDLSIYQCMRYTVQPPLWLLKTRARPGRKKVFENGSTTLRSTGWDSWVRPQTESEGRNERPREARPPIASLSWGRDSLGLRDTPTMILIHDDLSQATGRRLTMSTCPPSMANCYCVSSKNCTDTKHTRMSTRLPK